MVKKSLSPRYVLLSADSMVILEILLSCIGSPDFPINSFIFNQDKLIYLINFQKGKAPFPSLNVHYYSLISNLIKSRTKTKPIYPVPMYYLLHATLVSYGALLVPL